MEKVNYIDGVTLIEAQNLNDIQDAITAVETDKVDKVEDKGLSTNDYTDADKEIVENVPAELAQKADSADVYTKSETYTKTEVDTALQGKADSSAVYTKTETDTLLSAKASASDLEELEEEMTDYRQMYLDSLIHTTASGAIASFSDGFKDAAMDYCVAQIEPVQDLHGQANPYPAGGGKNKFQTTATTQTVNGTTFTVNDDGSVTVSGTPTAVINGGYVLGEVTLSAGTYKVNGCGNTTNVLRLTVYNVTASTSIASIYNNQDFEFTLTEESVIRLYPFVHTTYSGTQTIKPMIRLSSVTDATFEPYSNICPISGSTGTNVVRCGANLLDLKPYSEWTRLTNAYSVLTDTKLPKNTRFRLVLTDKDTSVNVSGMAFGFVSEDYTGGTLESDSFKWAFSNGSLNANPVNIPQNNDASIYLDRLIMYPNTEAVYNALTSRFNIQVKFTADQTYAPYTADTYSVTWESEAGTVYGGYVDLMSGVLTATKGYIASYNGETLPSTWISDRDVYAEGTTPTTGAEVCYELATPQTYQLTPQEVTTLLGSNNVWADTGDIDCGYVANTKLYIDSRI